VDKWWTHACQAVDPDFEVAGTNHRPKTRIRKFLIRRRERLDLSENHLLHIVQNRIPKKVSAMDGLAISSSGQKVRVLIFL
jgi:hypothetical protein